MLEMINPKVDTVVSHMLRSYNELGGINHIGGPNLPSRQHIIDLLQTLRSILLPGYYEREPVDEDSLLYLTGERLTWLRKNLAQEITRSLCHDCRQHSRCDQVSQCEEQAQEVADALLRALPDIRARLDALGTVRQRPDFAHLADLTKRVDNILTKGREIFETAADEVGEAAGFVEDQAAALELAEMIPRCSEWIAERSRAGDYRAVVPQVAGRAYLTGFHQFVLDPDDPFSKGFSLAGPD